jgi:hypothetical protein
MDIRIEIHVPENPQRSMEAPSLAQRGDASSFPSNFAKWGTFFNAVCSAGKYQLRVAHISITQYLR